MREVTLAALNSVHGRDRPRALHGLVLLALGLLAACGPMTLAEAERQCFERARLAQRPRGEILLGGSTHGAVADFDVTISSDYLSGRDPSAVYETCVMSKAGQPPDVPLYSRPDWKS